MVMQTIGSYEAKTRLAELLRQVQEGQEFEISVRGRVVARLLPATHHTRRSEAAERMKDFMLSQGKAEAGAGVDLRSFIDEGRA